MFMFLWKIYKYVKVCSKNFSNEQCKIKCISILIIDYIISYYTIIYYNINYTSY